MITKFPMSEGQVNDYQILISECQVNSTIKNPISDIMNPSTYYKINFVILSLSPLSLATDQQNVRLLIFTT